jgi:hypothetical protein
MSQPFPVLPFYDGVRQDTNDFLMESTSFPYLEDCYPYRGRIERRVGNQSLGRIVREITGGALGNTGASPFTINVLTFLGLTGSIQNDTVTVHVGAPGNLTFVEVPNLSNGVGNRGNIDYLNGYLTVNHPPGLPSAVTMDFTYLLTPPQVAISDGGANSGYINLDTGYITFSHGVGATSAITIDFLYYPPHSLTPIIVTNGSLGVTNVSPFIGNIFTLLGISAGAKIISGTITIDIAAPVGPVTFTEVASITLAGLVLGNTGASPFAVDVFTVLGITGGGQVQDGSVTVRIAAPIGPLVYTEVPNLVDAAGDTGNINYTTGVLSFNHGAFGASAVTIDFINFPERPVMGLYEWDTDLVNMERLIAFDTGKANIYTDANLEFTDISFTTAGVAINWHSTDADFFWCTNYWRDNAQRILFWATNGIADRLTGAVHEDGIQIYNGIGWEWQECRLDAGSTTFLRGCKILVSFKDHMIAMNTLEGAVQPAIPVSYPNRIRWSQNGIPYTTVLGGADITAWESATPGKGGFGDIPTNEQIISCGYWKDNLLIFCERSTWMLTFVGNVQYPFQLQKVNDHYGSQSPHSFIPTDKGIYSISNKGIVIGDGFNVERIDLKIPDEYLYFSTILEADRRIFGAVDYYRQFIYWIFPSNASRSDQQFSQFPDQMLVYNMQDQAWSIFNDRFTCLGQYRYVAGTRWEDLTDPWRTYNRPWFSFIMGGKFPEVIAGNQQGFVFYLRGLSLSNSESLAIRAITQAGQAQITSYNHNLQVGRYVEISGVEGMLAINNLYARVQSVIDASTFTVNIDSTGFAAYTRSGFITFLNNINITTKSFNPYYQKGERPRLNYLDFYFDYAPAGEISIDIYNNAVNSSALLETAITNTHKDFGGGFAIPRVWKRLFPDCEGQFFILKLYLSDSQMLDKDIQESNICLHAINMWMSSAGRLLSYDN